ncbi:hypothetical protein SAMN02745194_00606 [Roseomonas rosea]|uniref:Uncharacterized protein n=1 Tax=Muricoccus roseus TaxID=198092 RepID=A0A1M6C6V2_9PROT|nr:hypothetical protein [Roseomonas rosea]SHI56735.1 hypothetical protein SAMN02745194_00606 [Roseomonas rosea]
MLTPRIPMGLLGLGLIGLSALPAAAQSWPSDSGPTGDYLGSTVRQFERLAPPPVEAGGRGERPVPNMRATDLPGVSVDMAPPALSPARQAERAVPRRATRRGAYRAPAAASRSRGTQSREARLERALAAQDRRIRELERQIQQGR